MRYKQILQILRGTHSGKSRISLSQSAKSLEALSKIIEALELQPALKVYLTSQHFTKRATFSDLCLSACNHEFDNHPQRWGLTQNEAHKLRSYFDSKSPYESMRDILAVFSRRISPEDPRNTYYYIYQELITKPLPSGRDTTKRYMQRATKMLDENRETERAQRGLSLELGDALQTSPSGTTPVELARAQGRKFYETAPGTRWHR